MPGSTEVLNKSRSQTAVNQEVYNRSDGNGFPYINLLSADRNGIAQVGAAFTAVNTTTPGTGVQINANVTSFSDTTAFLIVQNPSGSGKNIYLDSLSLQLNGTAPTATTSMILASKVETSTRQASTAANNTPLTINAVNSQANLKSVATVLAFNNAGAFTVSASLGSARFIDQWTFPTSLGITGDEYKTIFGGVDEFGTAGLTAVRATAACKMVVSVSPHCVCPGEALTIYQFWLTAATTAATYSLALRWHELAV